MSTNSKNQGFFANLQYDLPASLVVFLVAIPLCLGIALASGAPLFSGIIAGMVGGIVVALLSGSPLGVSGPAAGLAVIVLTAIQELGAFETFLLAVVIAGALQLILGFLRAGVIGYYFPSSVIKGMLAGIGVIIFLKQIPHAFGYDADPEGDFAFQQVDGHNTFSEMGYMLEFISPGALLISALSLGILLLWERPFMKKLPTSKLIQGPLVAVLAGVGLNLALMGVDGWALTSEQMVSIPVADSLVGFFGQFTFPDFSQIGNSQVWIVAGTIAVVASLETLLCVEATDKLDPQKRITPTNRELTAQGIGNMVSGMIGGLPLTQVIVRSSANIQSGGRTKASAFFHGILILISAMAIPKLLNLIPLASLAAILLMVGYKLAKPSLFREMYRKGSSQFIPFVVTIVGIVLTDLLVGIALGMAVAVIDILWQNYKTPYHFDPDKHEEGQPVTIELAEEVSFLNKASIMRTLDQLPDGTEVIIDGSKTRSIHPDVIEIIDNFRENAKTKNITLKVIHLLLDRKYVDPVSEVNKVVSSTAASSNGKYGELSVKKN
ncbi:MAG: SulP family inorganic anion transporter [Bacteroidota bacterium]